jgi:hypothetical protein
MNYSQRSTKRLCAAAIALAMLALLVLAGAVRPAQAQTCTPHYDFGAVIGPDASFCNSSCIHGQGFTTATAVSFNGKAASFSVVSDTYLAATILTGATKGCVTVTDSVGILKSSTKKSRQSRKAGLLRLNRFTVNWSPGSRYRSADRGSVAPDFVWLRTPTIRIWIRNKYLNGDYQHMTPPR